MRRGDGQQPSATVQTPGPEVQVALTGERTHQGAAQLFHALLMACQAGLMRGLTLHRLQCGLLCGLLSGLMC